jgi:hypothetical protein
MVALIAHYCHFRKCGFSVRVALARAWQVNRHGF